MSVLSQERFLGLSLMDSKMLESIKFKGIVVIEIGNSSVILERTVVKKIYCVLPGANEQNQSHESMKYQ